jgi:hypothetical protein
MKSLFSYLVLAAACGIAIAPRNALGFEFAQGVIVDIARSVAYMVNSEGRIDAVNLSDGEVIATSTRGAKPLLLYDDVLLAEGKDQIDALRVVGLSTGDLKQKFAVDLTLSNRVRTSSFYVGARIDGNATIVQWRSIQRPMSPVPTREPAHVASGFARIDPATGRLIAAGEGEPPVPGSPAVEAPSTVQKLADKGALASPLCRVDDIIAALEYIQQNSGRRVTLRRWNIDTGEALPTINLFDGELAFRNFSRDCRYLLASREMDGWVWHIYSVITGKQIAEIHNPLPGPEFFVSGGNLIYQAPAVGESIAGRLRVEPPRLVAINIINGKELWARPIGETAYLGPPPPGNPRNPSTEQTGNGRK